MNANDIYIVKFLVVSQSDVSHHRETGQLLPMPVKMSSYAAQNVACPYGTCKAMPECGAFTHS